MQDLGLHRPCSPKSLQAPWETVPVSVVIYRVGKALRHGHARVRPNAGVYTALSLSGPTEIPKGLDEAAAGPTMLMMAES